MSHLSLTPRRRGWRGLIAAAATVVASACAQPIPVAQPEPSTDTPPPRTSRTARPRGAPVPEANAGPYQQARWPIKTSQHIDLWLHSFALVSEDTLRVPLYLRGYRDSLTVLKNRANVLTSLDVNRTTLAKRLAQSPSYLQAQFLPFEFGSWEEMRLAAERVALRDANARGGDARADRSAVAAGANAFAAIFPTAADREWLRLFTTGVQDEQLRFFNAEHSRLVRTRAAVITAVDSLWQRVYRPRFDRFLNNTGQRTGEVVLSVPIGGEGRSGVGRERQTVVVVPFPSRVADAAQVVLVLAHELTGGLVNSVITDNTTPAEQRDGQADRYVAMAQVRTGAMLIEKTAPELSDAYMRFYLAQSGVRTDVADVKTLFLRTYDIPAAIRDGLLRQLDIVLGGI